MSNPFRTVDPSRGFGQAPVAPKPVTTLLNIAVKATPSSTQNRVEVIRSVDYIEPDSPDHKLHFQQVIYHLTDGKTIWNECGFRFMWSHKGKLCGHRGQARIPDSTVMFKLINQAILDGWFKLPDGVHITFG